MFSIAFLNILCPILWVCLFSQAEKFDASDFKRDGSGIAIRDAFVDNLVSQMTVQEMGLSSLGRQSLLK